MSALQDGTAVLAEGGAKRAFAWKQSVPTSTYLIAIAVGELESREISNRCRVWSEPSMVDKVAYEFAETEKFLAAAESLTCPYQWGRYDVLCLPPSFPYGGMENPCLTFVTPTLLAGDRSLADVVAHEIAHSWTGNLVTNASWEHFWLNEGWTVWLERSVFNLLFFGDVSLPLACHMHGQSFLAP
jgi:leukotriene-A4 hydrolase